jgi:hypothetical protein
MKPSVCLVLLSVCLAGCTIGNGIVVGPDEPNVPSAPDEPNVPSDAKLPGDLADLPVVSTFDEGDHGWTVAGGPFTAATAPTWVQTGGSPDAWVCARSAGAWYWLAPDTFLGNVSAAYGGTLKFDLNQNVEMENCIGREKLVILDGGGVEIYCDAPYKTQTSWTSYTVRLDETEPWHDAGTGAPVTRAAILGVLADLSQLRIRGWFTTCGVETPEAGLDSVALDPPEVNHEPLVSVESAFDSGAERWTVAGGGFGLSGPLAWDAEAGSPGGFLSATGDGPWYWLAPPQFLGDASAAYGQVLKFDVNHNIAMRNCVQTNRFVILNGGGYAISWDAPYKPQVPWTSYTVKLHETELWHNLATGDRVTREQLQAVLADLSQLKIRGWYTSCHIDTPTAGLDSVLLAASADYAPPLVTDAASTFDADDEGWTIAGGDFQRSGPVRWNDAGGSPGGYASAVGGGAWYWLAPPKFLGDASAAYGRALKFDVLQNQAMMNCVQTDALVVLCGGGYEIHFDAPYKPDVTWTSYTVQLSETALWVDVATGQPVTRPELQAVLADLSQLRIRGWFSACALATPAGGLDNVVLELE